MPYTAAHIVNGSVLALLMASSVAAGRISFLVVGFGVAAAMYGIAGLVGWLVDHRPEFVNAPNQAKYDALPMPDKKRVMAVAQRWLCWETAGLLTVILALHLLEVTSASFGPSRETIQLAVILGFAVCSTAAAPFLIWRVSATIDDLYDQSDPTSFRRNTEYV